MRNSSQASPFTALITGAALIFLFAPLFIVILFSFHATPSLSFPFTGFSLRWYRQVLGSAEFRNAAYNSLIVGLASAGMTLVLGTMAAYGLSRISPRWQRLFTVLFFLPITLPGLFLGLALLVFFAQLEIHLSLATVTIAHLIYVFPYYLLIAKAALDRLDPALEETAADLGANSWAVFWRVTMPQIWSVLLGAASLAFALSFDEFVITFFVIGSESTLPMFVWSGIRRTIDPSINTISTLLLVVTLLLFAVAFFLTLRRQHTVAEA
jgi:ABC-type spermidine/putrescine transport system permease subunit II